MLNFYDVPLQGRRCALSEDEKIVKSLLQRYLLPFEYIRF